MNRHLIRPAPARVTVPDDATAEEPADVDRRFENLQDLLAEGWLILTGQCQDGPPGIVIFEARTDAAACEVLQSDPAVKAGVFHADMRPSRLALLGGAPSPPAGQRPAGGR